jgi:hypothetical protein
LLREFITMFVWVYSAPPLYLITHVLYNKSLQNTAFLAAVILWGYTKPPQFTHYFSLVFLYAPFILLFPPFPYSLPFQKKQKRNSVKEKRRNRLRLRVTQNCLQPPTSPPHSTPSVICLTSSPLSLRVSHPVKHLAASPVLSDFIFYWFLLLHSCFSPIS